MRSLESMQAREKAGLDEEIWALVARLASIADNINELQRVRGRMDAQLAECLARRRRLEP